MATPADFEREIAIVGNEGLIGIALFMGGETTTNRAVVQSAGSAYQLAGNLLKIEFERHRAPQHLLQRFTQALITQMSLSTEKFMRRFLLHVLTVAFAASATMGYSSTHALSRYARRFHGRAIVQRLMPVRLTLVMAASDARVDLSSTWLEI